MNRPIPDSIPAAAGYDVERFSPGSPRMEEFRRVAERLYAGDPFWTPPDDPPDDPRTSCFLVALKGTALGRVCGTVNPAIACNGEPTALAGWYECADDPGAARALLDAVAAHYRALGYRHLLGPLNGSTWYRYRLAEPTGEPPFFLDVHNKPWYPGQWAGAGFESAGRYHSTRSAPHAGGEGRIARFEERYRERGITIRPFAIEDFEEELRRLHAVSLAGFTGSPFYSPIGFDAFHAIYARVRPLVHPQFVLIAERGERPVGFIFALHNIHERERKSLVVKTVVALPEPETRGLGSLMVAMLHARAAALGYDEVIHALMHEANSSMNVLADVSRPYRSYTLFGRRL